MTTTFRIAVLFAALTLSACATPYQQAGFLNWEDGGFRVVQLRDAAQKPMEDRWRIQFDGNQNTTLETVRTYGLYRCATLALEKGFDGFEVIPLAQMSLAPAAPGFQKAQFIFIPVRIPRFAAEIRLLKKPFVANPPQIFDAAALKAALEPHVTGEKCEGGNVCPHTPDYLQPAPPVQPQAPAI